MNEKKCVRRKIISFKLLQHARCSPPSNVEQDGKYMCSLNNDMLCRCVQYNSTKRRLDDVQTNVKTLQTSPRCVHWITSRKCRRRTWEQLLSCPKQEFLLAMRYNLNESWCESIQICLNMNSFFWTFADSKPHELTTDVDISQDLRSSSCWNFSPAKREKMKI